MLTSKRRAELRAQANGIDTTLMVGKEGVSQSVIDQAETQLTARELVKGRVLESALMTAREVSDAICQATGAEGIQAVGSKFVIYRYSATKHQQPAPRPKAVRKSTANPVRKGVQKRRAQAKQAKQRRDEYFHEAAVQAAIARRKGENSD